MITDGNNSRTSSLSSPWATMATDTSNPGIGGPGSPWPTTGVALAFIALVGVMFWRATDSSNFTLIWAGVGTIVGVLTGAIPSFFFARTASAATNQVRSATEAATKKADQVTAFYAVTDDSQREAARMRNPAAFS
jgi:hypothetical protein